MNGSRGTSGPADDLRHFIFGDVPVDEWVARGDGDPGEPWASFERGRRLAQSGRPQDAARIWRQIATTDGLESRQTLQAWHFLRSAGDQPPADGARLVLGAVAEIPMPAGHDLLAAYRDGTARFLSHGGQAVIWEDQSVTAVQEAISSWLASAQVIAEATGPWDEPALPSLPAGHGRLMMLTPGGPHFGQGPMADLAADPVAGSFLTAATRLLQLITARRSVP